jgi:branched-chain amino acid transport system substrate-binding protein
MSKYLNLNQRAKTQFLDQVRRLMRKLYFLGLFMVVLTTLFSSSCSNQPETVNLGACLALNGSAAVYGESQKNGIDLAVNEINAGQYLGPNTLLTSKVVDIGSTPDQVVSAMNGLINETKVIGILGPTLSSQAVVADPLAQKAKIPVIAISNTVSGITEMGDFIFRCSLPESQVVANTIEIAINQYGIKRVGILWGNDDTFTVSSYQAFLNAVNKNNLQITADQTFKRGDSDFKVLLNKIINTGPDALIASAFVQEAQLIIQQARSLGFKGLIIGGNGFNSVDLIKQAGDSAEGVMVGTAWNINNNGAKNSAFVAAYKKVYAKEPDQFAAQSYTGVWLFAEAIRAGGRSDSESVRKSLLQIKNFETALGNFSFTAGREPLHASIVQIVHNGQFEILK